MPAPTIAPPSNGMLFMRMPISRISATEKPRPEIRIAISSDKAVQVKS